ncbi:hypothetical protein [Klebsiella michiganensis]|uniref:hypothetical protein n=1 Tax=Klebsiella michiganensis TaxID=1134687 RepID=UPI002AF6A35A|nr:hypothetical protein [Klebsiella michiganensis]
MTDITELAQREKFEAWAEERCALPWGYLKNRRTNTGYFSKHDYTSLWAAWKAAGAELVEALEKAQQYAKERDEENQDLMLTIGRFRVEREGLEAIRAAAEKLVRCKGRYHSEQNYRALAALFGVTTPDLPPIDGESRTVTAAAADVFSERQRQVTAEGWTPERDDEYTDGELPRAASCYALMAWREKCLSDGEYAASQKMLPYYWPWEPAWWKPTTPRRDLVKAAALILAEIERIDRAAGIKMEGE